MISPHSKVRMCAWVMQYSERSSFSFFFLGCFSPLPVHSHNPPRLFGFVPIYSPLPFSQNGFCVLSFFGPVVLSPSNVHIPAFKIQQPLFVDDFFPPGPLGCFFSYRDRSAGTCAVSILFFFGPGYLFSHDSPAVVPIHFFTCHPPLCFHRLPVTHPLFFFLFPTGA